MELNTNGDLFPAGTFRFKIIDVPEKGSTDTGFAFYQFRFAAVVDDEERPYSERFMVWLMAPICRAIGFDETKPGVFDFDAPWCLGKEVTATIVHETIAKGASMGKVVARMKEVVPVMAPKHRAAMAVQAPAGKNEDIPF